VLQKTKLVPN